MRPGQVTMVTGAWGLMICGDYVEILNNFIFEWVLCKSVEIVDHAWDNGLSFGGLEL